MASGVSFFDLFKIRKYKEEVERLKSENERISEMLSPEKLDADIAQKYATLSALDGEIASREQKVEDSEKKVQTAANKIEKLKEIYRAVVYAVDSFRDNGNRIPPSDVLDSMFPTVTLHIHSMDMGELRKAMRENEKRIDSVTEAYSARYTTKSNQAIYKLMVIALRAELQNILYDLKYQKLEQGVDNVKTVTAKYLAIACDGNQNIATTVTKFIGEIEYLFINAVKIEYEYYVKKEQARQEQIAIREQMKQEAAERKALELEKKRIEAEEEKFHAQIEELQERIKTESDAAAESLRRRILELEGQLSQVVLKKEDIANLQNGKAGNVYIISNLGSFGENMFKIGMTRRLDPQERIDELGSASVPFEFDVHSFIFSDDAVALEAALHERLSANRVNKVNMRKEFFYSTIDELEALTAEIAPTAEFHRTMVAEEYRHSCSSIE